MKVEIRRKPGEPQEVLIRDMLYRLQGHTIQRCFPSDKVWYSWNVTWQELGSLTEVEFALLGSLLRQPLKFEADEVIATMQRYEARELGAGCSSAIRNFQKAYDEGKMK